MSPQPLVRLTRAAEADLGAAVDHARAEGPGRAARLADGVEAALGHLASWPSSGRPGKLAGTREYLFPTLPFLMPYRVEDGVLVVLRFLHTSRQWPPTKPKPPKKKA
jgi:plasmid stabilization system protein ParE